MGIHPNSTNQSVLPASSFFLRLHFPIGNRHVCSGVDNGSAAVATTTMAKTSHQALDIKFAG
jgi:hypothetical protein